MAPEIDIGLALEPGRGVPECGHRRASLPNAHSH
jgi:hypothetical protein